MTTLYKLTDADGVTGADYGPPLQWAPGVTHEIPEAERRTSLCGDGVIHAYESPLVAAFMNPAHAAYDPARMWRCETDAEIIRDGELKCGAHRLTCVEEMPLPNITTPQRVRVAILCAWGVCDNPKWREWAQRWLSKEDRSRDSAEAAEAAPEVANAAEWAAAAAAARATWATTAAARAADVAWWVAALGHPLPLNAIIEQAIREEQ